MNDYYSKLVNRFLGWKLPATFGPDAGISFKPYHPQQTPDSHLWPIGTNLLTATEARAMLEHIQPPMPKNGYSTEAEGDAYTHGWFDGNEADPYGLPRWRHKKRGTYYTELGTARLQLALPVVIEEGAVLVIYRGDDGVLWARPEAEFKDGRFEQITAGKAGLAPCDDTEQPSAAVTIGTAAFDRIADGFIKSVQVRHTMRDEFIEALEVEAEEYGRTRGVKGGPDAS